jgi:hypothetical protein
MQSGHPILATRLAIFARLLFATNASNQKYIQNVEYEWIPSYKLSIDGNQTVRDMRPQEQLGR